MSQIIKVKQKKSIEPGIYNISNEDYKNFQGVSCNAAKLLAKSGLHYWDEYLDPTHVPKVKKEHFGLGNALHTLALEPHLFECRFFIMPEFTQKQVDKDKKQALLDELKIIGKIAISKQDSERAHEMSESLKKAIDLSTLKENEIEQSLFWKNTETGILCKSRPDIIQINKSIIADIKTTSDARWRKFKYSFKEYGYPLQFAMFIDGVLNLRNVRIKEVYAIAIESVKPYACVPYQVSEKTLSEGQEDFLIALKTYEYGLKNNKWPSYSMRSI